MHKDPESLIVCNGYKDPAYIRMALMGMKLGKSVIMVVEKLEELKQTIRAAKEVGVEPHIGIRVRLHIRAPANGRRAEAKTRSSGSTRGLVAASEMLKAAASRIVSS